MTTAPDTIPTPPQLAELTLERIEQIQARLPRCQEYGWCTADQNLVFPVMAALLSRAAQAVRAEAAWIASMPEGTKWVAMDRDGEWYAYSKLPDDFHVSGAWITDDPHHSLDGVDPPPFADPAADWRTTLREVRMCPGAQPDEPKQRTKEAE